MGDSAQTPELVRAAAGFVLAGGSVPSQDTVAAAVGLLGDGWLCSSSGIIGRGRGWALAVQAGIRMLGGTSAGCG